MTVSSTTDRLARRRLRPALPDGRDGRHRPRAARTSPTCASASTTSRASSSRTATRTTSARCRGSCASCARGRAAAGLRRAADDGDGALQARRAPPARTSRSRTSRPGRRSSSGPFDVELIHMTHSIPDAAAVAVTTELGTVLITGDYKFDQTPVDGKPADVARLAQLGARGPAAALRRLDERRPPGLLAERGAASARTCEQTFAALRGPDHRHLLRVEHPPRAAGRRRGRSARPQGRAARALDAQERRTSARTLGHIDVPDGHARRSRARSTTSPTSKLVIVSTGSQGEPLSALRRMAYHDHPQVELHARRHGRLRGDADPRQRARRQRDDRPALPHRLRRDHGRATRRSTPPATATRRSSS